MVCLSLLAEAIVSGFSTGDESGLATGLTSSFLAGAAASGRYSGLVNTCCSFGSAGLGEFSSAGGVVIAGLGASVTGRGGAATSGLFSGFSMAVGLSTTTGGRGG